MKGRITWLVALVVIVSVLAGCTPAAAPAPVAGGAEVIASPMPGKILKVMVSVGAAVNAGDVVLILEAMKMENEIMANVGGTVKEVRTKEGDSVNTGDVLVVIG